MSMPRRLPSRQFPRSTRELVRRRVAEVKRVPACRVCGCTDEDCRVCIEAQGFPCSWVEPNLCSRCARAIKASKAGG